MAFYSAALPDELQADSFLLRPLRADDNALDYAAMCDRWETQAWIAEGNDFTLETNLTALRRHEKEHREREAFTFTIMNRDQTECLGCVYIAPLLPLLQKGNATEEMRKAVTENDAAVRFWVRDAYRIGDWNRKVLRTLIVWLRQAWTFPNVMFHTNADDARQRNLFESHHFELVCLLDLSYGAFYRSIVPRGSD